jgi:hypothetical protein
VSEEEEGMAHRDFESHPAAAVAAAAAASPRDAVPAVGGGGGGGGRLVSRAGERTSQSHGGGGADGDDHGGRRATAGAAVVKAGASNPQEAMAAAVRAIERGGSPPPPINSATAATGEGAPRQSQARPIKVDSMEALAQVSDATVGELCGACPPSLRCRHHHSTATGSPAVPPRSLSLHAAFSLPEMEEFLSETEVELASAGAAAVGRIGVLGRKRILAELAAAGEAEGSVSSGVPPVPLPEITVAAAAGAAGAAGGAPSAPGIDYQVPDDAEAAAQKARVWEDYLAAQHAAAVSRRSDEAGNGGPGREPLVSSPAAGSMPPSVEPAPTALKKPTQAPTQSTGLAAVKERRPGLKAEDAVNVQAGLAALTTVAGVAVALQPDESQEARSNNGEAAAAAAAVGTAATPPPSLISGVDGGQQTGNPDTQAGSVALPLLISARAHLDSTESCGAPHAAPRIIGSPSLPCAREWCAFLLLVLPDVT